MSNRILDYPEATAITSDDYILLDNADTGAKCIKASALNINMDNYTIKEARGSIASFDDGEDLPLAFLGAYITALQDLHGYDYPWVGGSGLNLFHMNSSISQTSAGVVYTSDDNYMILNNTKSGGSTANFNNTTITLPLGTYYAKAFAISGTASKVNQSFNLRDNSASVVAFDLSTVGTFTLSAEKTLYLSTTIWEDGITYNNYKIGIVVSKTSGIDKFYPYSNECPIIGWDECKVTVADDLENPTVSNVYTIDLDGTRYGGKLDVVSGVLTVDKGYVDLGTLDWQYSSISERFYVGASDLGVKATDASTPFNAISSALIAKSYNEIEAKTVDYAIAINPNATQLFARYSSITSASDFITAMNGVQLVYELATPLTYQLTPTMIYSLIGENNIFADTGDSIVDYRKLWVKPEM